MTVRRWSAAAAMLALGLYLGRVAAEALPGTRRTWEALLLALGGLALAWAARQGCRRLSLPIGAWLALWLAVLWPAASPSVTWMVGLATLAAWLWSLPGWRAPRLALEGGLLLGGLALFGATVAPGLLPADSGEFQLVTAVLGIAHPPGYPLYTLLGKLATLVPLGEIALRLNLLSVLLGALTLASLAGLVRAAAGGRERATAWGGGLAALALAFSATFWSQATTANIRSLTALFTALAIWLLVRWQRRPTAGRLAAFGLVLGLAVGHHASLALLALPMAAYVLSVEPRLILHPRRWLFALAAIAASFAVLLYLPLRSAMQPAFDPVPVDSVARFFEHVLATGFRGDMLYFATLPQLLERARIYVQILGLQFGTILPWAMALSLAWVLRRNWRLGLLLGGLWLVNALSALTYRAPQTVEYLLPSYVAMVACLGCGVAYALERLPRAGSAALLTALSLAVAWNGLAAWPSFLALHGSQDTREYAEAILQQAPADALVLANWHWATPLYFLQQVEGLRPDVTVEYVYPEGALTNEEVWLARIVDAIGDGGEAGRPVVVTNRYHGYEATGYQFEPLGEAWLVRDAAPERPPLEALPVQVTLSGQVEVEAYRLEAETVSAGGTLRVTLYWRPVVPLERDYAVFVQLVGPQGVVGQADRAQPTRGYAVGALRVDAYELPLLLQTPPGDYDLIAGFYVADASGWERLTTSSGADHVRLGSVSVVASDRGAATLHPLEARFEAGVRLRGLDVDRSVAGQTRLYLHWLGESAAASQALRVTVLRDGQPLAAATLPSLMRGQTATLALDLPTDAVRITLRLEDEQGRVVRCLGPWGLPWRDGVALRLPEGDQRYVPLGDAMVYLGLADAPQSLTAGEPAAIRPRLMALRPLLRDYSLSVGLVGAEAGWERKADGTPAMGAIPTLKWLTGWVVTGPHAPAPPADASAGEAQITLSVYDAFTLAPLAVLDERLAREGQGQFLRVGQAPVTVPAD